MPRLSGCCGGAVIYLVSSLYSCTQAGSKLEFETLFEPISVVVADLWQEKLERIVASKTTGLSFNNNNNIKQIFVNFNLFEWACLVF